MAELTQEGLRIVEDAARRYGMSTDAVRVLLEALVASGGGMAQFNHPELGGMGQWSSGGMIMIGSHSMPMPESSFFVSDPGRTGGGNWWPFDLGMPASTGAQNNMRYACFPDRRRLALDVNGQISVYDTGDHWITGFSQQQSGDQSLTFTSQYGVVRLDSLPLVDGPGSGFAPNAPVVSPQPAWRPEVQPVVETPQAGGDIFSSIERLAALRDKGIISEAEFAAKKTELLGRL